MYCLQNAAVFLSAAAVLPLLSVAGEGNSHGWLYWLLVTCTIAFGSISTVGSMGSTLAVERQWTKALCLGDFAALSALNSGMPRLRFVNTCSSPKCHCVQPPIRGFVAAHANVCPSKTVS